MARLSLAHNVYYVPVTVRHPVRALIEPGVHVPVRWLFNTSGTGHPKTPDSAEIREEVINNKCEKHIFSTRIISRVTTGATSHPAKRHAFDPLVAWCPTLRCRTPASRRRAETIRLSMCPLSLFSRESRSTAFDSLS